MNVVIATARGRTMSEPTADFAVETYVVGVVEEIVTRKLVTLIVPSLVVDEFRRLGWIYPSRLIVTNRALQR